MPAFTPPRTPLLIALTVGCMAGAACVSGYVTPFRASTGATSSTSTTTSTGASSMTSGAATTTTTTSGTTSGQSPTSPCIGPDGGSLVPALPAGTGSGTTYYVSPSGSDTNDGLTPATAWQTLTKALSMTYQAGDSLLFEGGATFTGCPVFQSGKVKSTAAAPFTVGAYGTGRFTVQTDCSGAPHAGVSIAGINGFVLQDMALVGDDGGAMYGVFIYNPTSSVTTYVRVERCDITGFFAPGDAGFGGEVFIIGYPNALDQILILDNQLHGSSGPTSPDDNGISGFGDGQNITNVLYQGNTVYDLGAKPNGPNGSVGNGILGAGLNGAVTQCNVAHDCGGNTTTCGGPAGIWTVASSNVTIQYNEAYGMKPAGPTPSDACDWDGFDLDKNVTHSTVQYNYAHDNFGVGFLAYINGTWAGNTYRDNIGQNDGTEMDLAGQDAGTGDLAIYNNTFFSQGAGESSYTVAVAGGGHISGITANNIFYASGGATLVNMLSWNTADASGITFEDNDYFTTSAFALNWDKQSYGSLSSWSAATHQEMRDGAATGWTVDP